MGPSDGSELYKPAIQKPKRPEDYFLPLERDFVRCAPHAELPPEEYQRLYRIIHQSLVRVVGENPEMFGQGWYNDKNDLYAVRAETILDLGKTLEEAGVKAWQVALVEPFCDEGVTPKIITGANPKDTLYNLVTKSSEVSQEMVEQLRDWGYSEGWSGVFPHVNLHHLMILARRYPQAIFSSDNQSLEFIPVPGVQFNDYQFGVGMTLGSLSDTAAEAKDGWDVHWGEKYTEEFKAKIRERLVEMEREGRIGGMVMDIGCGKYPLIADLTCRKVLVDKEERVKDLADVNTVPICWDVGDFGSPAFTEQLEKVMGENIEKLSAAVMVDILNYKPIDWRKLLFNLKEFMKPGGMIFISNMPGYGYSEEFSPARPRNNLEIVQFLQESLGCEIELVQDASQFCGLSDQNLPVSCYSQIVILARMNQEKP